MGRKKTLLDDLFTSEGEVRKKAELSPFFLRPAYQYTCAEIHDTEQQELHEEDWKK